MKDVIITSCASTVGILAGAAVLLHAGFWRLVLALLLGLLCAGATLLAGWYLRDVTVYRTRNDGS